MNNEKYLRWNMMIQRSLYEEMKKAATKSDMSVSAFIRQAVREKLKGGSQ